MRTPEQRIADCHNIVGRDYRSYVLAVDAAAAIRAAENDALERAAKLFDGVWGFDDDLRKGCGMLTISEESATRIRALKHPEP